MISHVARPVTVAATELHSLAGVGPAAKKIIAEPASIAKPIFTLRFKSTTITTSVTPTRATENIGLLLPREQNIPYPY
jgi:hypothetical protein